MKTTYLIQRWAPEIKSDCPFIARKAHWNTAFKSNDCKGAIKNVDEFNKNSDTVWRVVKQTEEVIYHPEA